MATLERPGVFAMLVPDSWAATFSDGTYELTQEGQEGALHLTPLRRLGDGPLGDAEVEEMVIGFLDHLEPIGRTEVMALKEDSEQHRAIARCVSNDPATGEMCSWLVFVVLWLQRAIMCTCAAPFGSGMIDEAERMFATICPHQA